MTATVNETEPLCWQNYVSKHVTSNPLQNIALTHCVHRVLEYLNYSATREHPHALQTQKQYQFDPRTIHLPNRATHSKLTFSLRAPLLRCFCDIQRGVAPYFHL